MKLSTISNVPVVPQTLKKSLNVIICSVNVIRLKVVTGKAFNL